MAAVAVGAPDTLHEREAERVADEVTSGPSGPHRSPPSITPLHDHSAQASCACEETVQRAGAGPPGGELALPTGGGAPLATPALRRMSGRFGHDFAGVRIHHDGEADRLAEGIGARAFTIGNHVYFRVGEYAPGTPAGDHLLAHELTHVVQQGGTQSVAQRDLGDDISAGFNAGVNWVDETTAPARELVGEGVDYVAGEASEALAAAQQALVDYLQQHAPLVLALLNGSIAEQIREHVLSALDASFGGLGERIRSDGLLATLQSLFPEMVAGAKDIAADVAGGDCGSLFALASRIGAFINRLLGPIFDDVSGVIGDIAGFFGDLWTQFGKPALEAVKKVAGAAWTFVSETAEAAWELVSPIVTTFGELWESYAAGFDMVWDSAASLLGTVTGFLTDIWDDIVAEIEPYKTEILAAVGVALLFTPAAPVVIVAVGVPLAYQGISYLIEHWNDIGILVSAREFLSSTLYPMLQGGLAYLSAAMATAGSMLSSMAQTAIGGITSLIEALGGAPLLAALATAFDTVATGINDAIAWIQNDFVGYLQEIGAKCAAVLGELQPLIVLGAAILLFPVNPFLLYVVIAGWAWRALPECFKPAIIDFAIGLMISLIEALPDFEALGEAWPLAKAQLIDVLTRSLALPSDEKIAMSNKVARFMTGEDFTWVITLVNAARQVPDHFEGQFEEELIGINLTTPLAFERGAPGGAGEGAPSASATSAISAVGADPDSALLRQAGLAPEQISARFSYSSMESSLMEELALADGASRELFSEGEGGWDALREGLAAAPTGDGAGSGAEGEVEDTEALLQQMMDQPFEAPCGEAAAPATAAPAVVPESERIGPLTRGQRARYMWAMMRKGLGHWFDCNKHWLVPAIIIAAIALLAVILLTEGAALGVIVEIMEVVGTIMIGVAAVRVAYYVGEFVAKAFSDDAAGAAVALARGLAVAAVELIFLLLFELGGRAIRAVLGSGAKGGARAGARAVAEGAEDTARVAGAAARGSDDAARGTARAVAGAERSADDAARAAAAEGRTGAAAADDAARGTARSASGASDDAARAGARVVAAGDEAAVGGVRRFGRAVLRNGRIVLDTIGEGFARGVRRIGELIERIRGFFNEIRGMRIVREGRWFFIEILYNPWARIAGMRIDVLDEAAHDAVFLTDDQLRALAHGGQTQSGPIRLFEVAEYLTTTSKGRGVVGDLLTGDHIPSRAAILLARIAERERTLGRALTTTEFEALAREARDLGVTVTLTEDLHKLLSRTYGGRNTASQIAGDAADLVSAFRRDAEAILGGLHAQGVRRPDIVGAYLRAYQENVRRGVFAADASIDAMLNRYLRLAAGP
ncbi:MAG TPA: DUF4157 domain-containing protein [Chitinolyticbacter sp.]|nr:DUF4157 domain-containing protein [Chitinolyticbacter sp.]